jgi:GNAT superfamily N-acetyltransferase
VTTAGPDDPVEVRVVGPDEWSTWREIRLRALQDSPSAFGSTYARELAFTEDDWRDRLGSADGVCVLAGDVARPIGMGGGFQDLPGFLHVVAMWVDPAARGRGVGQAVLRSLADWAGAHGLRLHLDVNTANPGARRAYERYGFVGTGETRPLRDGSSEVIERMVLPEPSPLQRHAAENPA